MGQQVEERLPVDPQRNAVLDHPCPPTYRNTRKGFVHTNRVTRPGRHRRRIVGLE
jgi:hypothetical protein